jgi:tRNA(Ile)-lysidine synthase
LIYIHFPKLLQSPSPHVLLYEILKPYGFPNSAASEILNVNTQRSGRRFFGRNCMLVYDRQALVLQILNDKLPDEYLIDEETANLCAPTRLEIEQFDRPQGYVPDRHPHIACLDADKLQFPLILRRWKYGDAFQPLGMKHTKSMKQFFTDNKLSLIDKQRHRILTSCGQIIWVVGLRIDERFKITDATTRIIRIRLTGFNASS